MRGDFKHVWKRMWGEVWLPLAEGLSHSEMFFADIFRGLQRPPQPPAEPQRPEDTAFDIDGNLVDQEIIAHLKRYKNDLESYQLARENYELVSNGKGSKEALREIIRGKGESEIGALGCLSKTYAILIDIDEFELADKFKKLVDESIDTYGLSYRLVDPFILVPTVPGMISRLFQEMKRLSSMNDHLKMLFEEYEESWIDLNSEPTPSRIKNCIHKQFILVEGVAKQTYNVNGNTLGAICDQLQSWPHVTLKDVGKKLYGFRSDYPGLGHAGNPDAVLRQVDLKDFVALSCFLAGLYPYLHAQIDPLVVYRG